MFVGGIFCIEILVELVLVVFVELKGLDFLSDEYWKGLVILLLLLNVMELLSKWSNIYFLSVE